MGWTNNRITTLIIPTGATTGARIVINGLTGLIQIYDSTNTLVDQIGGAQGQIQTIGTSGAKIVLNPSATLPEIDFISADGLNTTKLTQDVPSLGNVRLHASNVTNLFVDTGGLILGTTAKVIDPVAGYPTVESWHTLTLQNGWTGTMKYRLVPSPANTVQILSNTLTAGTKTNGTVVATLPAGYLPTTAQDLPGTCDNVVAGGQSPHWNVAANGNISCQGYTATTFGAIDGLLSLDF